MGMGNQEGGGAFSSTGNFVQRRVDGVSRRGAVIVTAFIITGLVPSCAAYGIHVTRRIVGETVENNNDELNDVRSAAAEQIQPNNTTAADSQPSTGAGNDGVTEEPSLGDVLGNATGQLGGGDNIPSGATVPDATGLVTEPQTFVSENETGIWGAIRQECGSVSDAGIGLIIEASGLTNDYMVPPNTPTVLECGAAIGS